MARIKLGATVVGIRGTVGGITFSANKSGPFARSWSKPSNPRTPPQGGNRALLSTHGPYWLLLSPAQRTAWNAYAADPAQQLTDSLGQAYYASGFNWFCSINQNLVNSARARRSDPPAGAAPATPVVTTLYCWSPIAADDDVNLNWASGTWTGLDLIIWATYNARAYDQAISVSQRLLYNLTQDTLTSVYLGTEFLALWGQPIIGLSFILMYQAQSSEGRRGALRRKNALVTAHP